VEQCVAHIRHDRRAGPDRPQPVHSQIRWWATPLRACSSPGAGGATGVPAGHRAHLRGQLPSPLRRVSTQAWGPPHRQSGQASPHPGMVGSRGGYPLRLRFHRSPPARAPGGATPARATGVAAHPAVAQRGRGGTGPMAADRGGVSAGGSIRPVLANLDWHVRDRSWVTRYAGLGALVRYADDGAPRTHERGGSIMSA
jgi:hypothetical protein